MRPLSFSSLLLAVVAAAACTAKTSDGPGPTESATPTQTAVASPTPNGGTTLTTDTIWSAANPQQIGANLTVGQGVTLTVTSSAVVAFSPGVSLLVQGTLLINGAAANPLVFDVTGGSGDGTFWGGIEVQAGGSAKVQYLTINDATYPIKVEAGAGQSAWLGLTINDGEFPFQVNSDSLFCRTTLQGVPGTSFFSAGKTTFQDSKIIRASPPTSTDALNFSADLELDYSIEDGTIQDGWHCLTHSGGAGNITVSHSIMQNAHYAFMLSGVSTGTIEDSFIAIQADQNNDFGPAAIDYTGDTITASGDYWANVLSIGVDGAPPNCTTVQNSYVNSGYTVSACAQTSSGVLAAAGPRVMNSGCETTFPNPLP